MDPPLTDLVSEQDSRHCGSLQTQVSCELIQVNDATILHPTS